MKTLRPVPQKQELISEARVVHVSRNIAILDGTLKTTDGRL
ncbi:hypothetical protein [Comamonas terrigena]|nr:hypothetical protein [Comamonas terrigena]